MLLCLTLDIIVIVKLYRKQDLTLFDLISVLYTVYFVLTPLRCAVGDVDYRNVPTISIVNQTNVPLICIFVVKIVLYLCSYFFKHSKYLPFINITQYIRQADQKISLSADYAYIFIIAFVLITVPLVSYGDLTDENVEGNMTYFYGANMPLWQRLLVNMLKGVFATLVLLTIKIRLQIQKDHRRLINICLIVMIPAVLLGGRTNLFNIILLVFLYFYSIKPELFNKRNSIIGIIVLVLVTTVYFPFYQSFRSTKAYLINNSSEHSFMDVMQYFFTSSDVKDIAEKAEEGTKGRSFNVYFAFFEATTEENVSTHGEYLMDNLLCLNPFHKPNPKLENIFAEKLEGGGDIAESMPTVMYCDIGPAGLLLIPLYYLLYFIFTFWICKLAVSIFRTKAIVFLFIALIVQRCLGVEGSVALRDIYNPNVIVIMMFAAVMAVGKIIFSRKQI